jgi:hypothetical protein
LIKRVLAREDVTDAWSGVDRRSLCLALRGLPLRGLALGPLPLGLPLWRTGLWLALCRLPASLPLWLSTATTSGLPALTAVWLFTLIAVTRLVVWRI